MAIVPKRKHSQARRDKRRSKCLETGGAYAGEVPAVWRTEGSP